MKAMRSCGLLLLLAGSILHPAAAQTPPAARHMLWKVEGRSNVVYLLGSIHLLRPEHYPLAPPIETAFANARIAAFETDISELKSPDTQMKLAMKALSMDGETLEQQLSPATYIALTNYLNRAELPVQMFEMIKPGMVAMMLEAMSWLKLGLDPTNSMDLRLYDRARNDGKQIISLETVDAQMDAILNLSKADADLFIRSTLKEAAEGPKQFGEMVRAWQTGDVASLDRQVRQSIPQNSTLSRRLVTDRNRQWLPQIEELLRGRTNAIVIVGTGHLVGTEGVVELLRQRGMKITQQ